VPAQEPPAPIDSSSTASGLSGPRDGDLEPQQVG
jgi:hypothetical protein